MAQLFETSLQPAIDQNGRIASGAKMAFYLSGSSTLASTFADQSQLVPHTNPVVADNAGRFPPVFLDPNSDYRVTLTESDGQTTLWEADPVRGASETRAALVRLPNGQTLADKLAQLRTFLDFNPAADGITPDDAAFQAFVDSGGGYIPRANHPYVIADTIQWPNDCHVQVEPGTQIRFTGAAIPFPAEGDLEYGAVFLFGDNCSLTVDGSADDEFEIISASPTPDRLRFAVVAAGKANPVIHGLRTRGMCHVWTKSSTGASPTAADVYANVITSGPDANVCTNADIFGGGASFNLPLTGRQSHGATAIFYTIGWQIKRVTYFNVPGGPQWWGGDAYHMADGSVDKECKCSGGFIDGIYIDTCVGGGIWGSKGRDIEVYGSGGRNAGDVGLDGEGCGGNVRFNHCFWDNAVNGAIAAFHFNRGLEYNHCRVSQDNALHPIWFISNPAQSQDNNDISIIGLRAECYDALPGFTVTSAVKQLTVRGGDYRNVLIDACANGNHNTNIDGVTLHLKRGMTNHQCVATANPESNIVAHTLAHLTDYHRVRFSSSDALPGGLAANVDYYTVAVAGGIKLATTPGNITLGNFVDIADAGTGVLTMKLMIDLFRIGGNNSNSDGASGRASITDCKVYFDGPLPDGSEGVFCFQFDYNSSPLTIIAGNEMPDAGMRLLWAGQNGGNTGIYHAANNITNNSIAVSNDNAAGAGRWVVHYMNNRNALGVPFSSGAAIADPAGGATVDAESRAALAAILAQMRASGAIAS